MNRDTCMILASVTALCSTLLWACWLASLSPVVGALVCGGLSIVLFVLATGEENEP